ncbi:MAG: chemotaxis protein CheD [Deltaproteobacteria bacterium]|nr:chemotaxis protein CheD [Deltaproteobacteria bacterium]MBW2030877.1 chemotaxis protein CheD [Deltaproteobacteria bacterium]
MHLKTGELLVAEGHKILYTGGVGSCVVVCFWDGNITIGGMAHIPHPTAIGYDPDMIRLPAFSPGRALPLLLHMMEKRGARRETTSARLVGAGNMFDMPDDCFMANIGRSILEEARNIISGLHLVITGESVGGLYGRSIRFDIVTGEVFITFTNGESLTL